MIDNFKQFELNQNSYFNAAKKAAEYGLRQKSKRLSNWGNIAGTIKNDVPPHTLGYFNLDMSVYRRTSQRPNMYRPHQMDNYHNIECWPTNLDIAQLKNLSNRTTGIDIVYDGPIKAYLRDIYIDCKTQPSKYIRLVPSFHFFDKNNDPIFSTDIPDPIVIEIPISWTTDGEHDGELYFKVAGEYNIRNHDESRPNILFDDRRSATKLKMVISKISEYYKDRYDQVSDFFKEYSYGEEFSKFLEILKSIPVHKLYKD